MSVLHPLTLPTGGKGVCLCMCAPVCVHTCIVCMYMMSLCVRALCVHVYVSYQGVLIPLSILK